MSNFYCAPKESNYLQLTRKNFLTGLSAAHSSTMKLWMNGAQPVRSLDFPGLIGETLRLRSGQVRGHPISWAGTNIFIATGGCR